MLLQLSSLLGGHWLGAGHHGLLCMWLSIFWGVVWALGTQRCVDMACGGALVVVGTGDVAVWFC